jgi:hypothetical protein
VKEKHSISACGVAVVINNEQSPYLNSNFIKNNNKIRKKCNKIRTKVTSHRVLTTQGHGMPPIVVLATARNIPAVGDKHTLR